MEVPDEYPWIMLAAALICFECLVVGFAVGGGKRRALFSAQALNRKFGDEHFKYFKSQIPGDGYPDHGNGYYSSYLTFKDWFEFNIDQRIHKNFLETLTVTIVNLLVLGLLNGQAALICGVLIFTGRLVYTMGYKVSVNGRLFGVTIVFLSIIYMFGANCFYLYQAISDIPDKPVTA